ncbi:hypothetical protein MNEG_4303 [Monoraphidium neglectum]|uniref:Ubiquitin conjugation factor E4 core domain-containing protein n=1 Tax=Monoraphidium neglectum TaxID=145388 RepID=A0A0D2MLC9_9CHLO|nr:hypothetical protein MNEG_4303 [Monoraphidium neglectum]KIZ03660.1 hypothetical protein MNEG_4303 [Monoraphidium neglectum]|eukprot:XP_013902679.1 hypothetical protein MNEG_4303 [Monoraphidium neglectum]
MAQAMQAAGMGGGPGAGPAQLFGGGDGGGAGGDQDMEESGSWEDGGDGDGSWEEELGADAGPAPGPAAARPHAPAQPAPAWAAALRDGWWRRRGGAGGASGAAAAAVVAAAPIAGLPEALKALSDALGMPVVSGLDSQSGPPPAGALILPLGEGSGGGVTVSSGSMDMLVSTWASRRTAAAAAAGPGGQLQLLVQAFHRAPAPAALTQGGAPLVELLRGRLAHRALQLLVDDEDDLFYDQGRYHSALLEAMASGAVPEAFLAAMAGDVASEVGAQRFDKVLRDSFASFLKLKLEEGQGGLEGPLIRLDMATREGLPLLQLLAGSMATEALALPRHKTEGGCVMGPLLGLTSMPDPTSLLSQGKVVSPAREVFASLRGYPNNQGDSAGGRHLLENYLSRVHDAGHQVLMRLVKVKAEGVPAQSGREVVMDWLAALADANNARTGGGEMGALRSVGLGASDGFCINLTAVLLRMARPFVQGALQGSPKFADLFTKHLSPSWYRTQRRRRLAEVAGVPVATLSGDRGIVEGDGGEGGDQGAKPPPPLMADDPTAAAAETSFIADVFFLTQRHLHTGLMPAVHRHNKLMEHFYRSLAASGAWPPGARAAPLEWHLAQDTALPALMHPDLAVDAVQFCALQLQWLASLLADPKQHAAFRSIPEYVVGDIDWLAFVILQGNADMLASVNIAALMRALVALLEHPELVKSLLVVSKVVHLLLVMLSPQMQVSRRADSSGGAFGSSYMRPGEAALVAAVLGAPATRELLVPALMRVYGQADFVVGLDVDR